MNSIDTKVELSSVSPVSTASTINTINMLSNATTTNLNNNNNNNIQNDPIISSSSPSLINNSPPLNNDSKNIHINTNILSNPGNILSTTSNAVEYSIFEKLFVTNIPGSLTQEQFSQLLLPYQQNGGLKDLKFFKRVVTDTCYAFLEFESGVDGKKCLDALDRRILNGNTIRVGPASRRNPYLSPTNIYVEGLPKQWGDMELRKFFESYGTINAARVLYDKHTNESREVGFVHFDMSEVAQAAMEDWNGKKPFPDAPREFMIKFANKGKKERTVPNQRPVREVPRPRKPRHNENRDVWDETNNEISSARYNEICKYHTRGNCKRGRACFYRHENGEGGSGGSGGSGGVTGDGYGYDQGYVYEDYYNPMDNQGYEYGYNTYESSYNTTPYASGPNQTMSTMPMTVATQVATYPSTQQNMYSYSQAPNTVSQWGGYMTQPNSVTASTQPQWNNYYQQTSMNPSQTTANTIGAVPQLTNGYPNQSSGYYALTTPQVTVAATAPNQSMMSAGYGAVRTPGGLAAINARYHPYQMQP